MELLDWGTISILAKGIGRVQGLLPPNDFQGAVL